MMANIYRVVAEHTASHKGYRDVVQQTDPMISGQLRVKNVNSQTSRNQLIISRTCIAGSRKTKPGDLPNLKVKTKFAASCAPGVRKIYHTLHQQWQVTGKEKGRTANPTLWDDCFFNHEENHYLAATQDNKVALGNPVTYEIFVGQPSGDSLDFLRCRRLTSPTSALTMNWAVLSPSSLTNSTASATSCGTRALIFCDLLLMLFGGITGLHIFLWVPVYTKINFEKELMWVPLDVYSGCQLDAMAFNNSEAPVDCTPPGASNHNVNEAYTMACQHSTQTRPKFVYLFLGTPNEFPDSTPTVLRAEADTENDARAKFPRWTLTFAAQIRTEAPCRLQIFSTDEGFMWVYEQRQTVSEAAHA